MTVSPTASGQIEHALIASTHVAGETDGRRECHGGKSCAHSPTMTAGMPYLAGEKSVRPSICGERTPGPLSATQTVQAARGKADQSVREWAGSSHVRELLVVS